MSLSRLIARIIMVPFGLVLALIAAGIFLSFALHAMEPMHMNQMATGPQGMPGEMEGVFTVFSGIFLASVMGSIAFYPAIIGLIVAEFFSLRSLWIYLLYGLVLSLFATHGPGEPVDSLAIALDIRAVAAGLIGGFVYWLVSGRGAGIVRRTLDNRPKNI